MTEVLIFGRVELKSRKIDQDHVVATVVLKNMSFATYLGHISQLPLAFSALLFTIAVQGRNE